MNIPLASIDYISNCIFRISVNSPYYIFTMMVILGPTVGYFDQLRKMIINKSPFMFNKHTALIQMLSNLLRFIYWQFEPYIFYLLCQSICVFSLQLILSFLSFHYMDPGEIFDNEPFIYNPLGYRIPIQSGSEKHYNFFYIYKATTAMQFFLSLCLYFCIILLIFQIGSAIIGYKNMATVTILLSNIIDSFTSLPQFVQIVWYREIENVSSVLVAQFLAGDIMKLCMYILGHAAWPFKFGASLQTCLDTILLISYVRQKCFAQPTNQQSRRNSMQEEILPK